MLTHFHIIIKKLTKNDIGNYNANKCVFSQKLSMEVG